MQLMQDEWSYLVILAMVKCLGLVSVNVISIMLFGTSEFQTGYYGPMNKGTLSHPVVAFSVRDP